MARQKLFRLEYEIRCFLNSWCCVMSWLPVPQGELCRKGGLVLLSHINWPTWWEYKGGGKEGWEGIKITLGFKMNKWRTVGNAWEISPAWCLILNWVIHAKSNHECQNKAVTKLLLTFLLNVHSAFSLGPLWCLVNLHDHTPKWHGYRWRWNTECSQV